MKERFETIIAKYHASEGILLAVGVSALLVGILVDIFFLRLVCLLVVIGSAGLMYAGMRAHHLNIQTGLKGASSLFHSQHESEIMKKLIFDDFHFHSKSGFKVEEVHHESAESEVDATAISSQVEKKVSATVQPVTHVKSMPVPVIREFQVSDFCDVDSDIYKGDAEPRTEFDFLLNKVLVVIKEVLFAHTVAFFWANREKQQMVLEARVTDSPNFITSRRFAIGHDLVSKVAQTGKPEFITEVNPVSEPELLRYYAVTESVKSFIGVPVFFSRGSQDATVEQPVAVVAVDGKAEDEFGQETLQLLGQFTKLISALIKSYNDKYDLLIDSELLSSIRRLQERIRNNFSLSTIVQSLGEETSKLINWDFLSIVLYEEKKHAWVAKKVTNRSHLGYILSEQPIDFPDSIVGQTIRNNTHCLADDLSMVTTPRYFMAEKLESYGSFLSVPISSLNKCY
ncbi:MAG: GAF domain-containing protein, partial [Ignavibacteriales bacterium]|nr:GAF domain-containing protein [Ignavibacteriales bacterium]